MGDEITEPTRRENIKARIKTLVDMAAMSCLAPFPVKNCACYYLPLSDKLSEEYDHAKKDS